MKREKIKQLKNRPEGGITVKKFKSTTDRREWLEKMRAQEKKKPDQKTIKSVKKTYRTWTPIEDMNRSFFIWHGKVSGSQKEKEIYNILKSHNLRFYYEVSFDLKKRFDFYIPLLDLVIEYDGGQHFSEMKHIKNDIMKEELLKKLGIKLIRYNKTHNLKEQIAHDLIHHEVLKS